MVWTDVHDVNLSSFKTYAFTSLFGFVFRRFQVNVSLGWASASLPHGLIDSNHLKFTCN